MIDVALIACLRRAPDVAALVDGRVFQDFRPSTGPGSELPAIVIQHVDDDPITSADGTSGTTHGFFDFEFYAETVPEISELAEAIRFWCNDFRGRIKGVEIKDMRLKGPSTVLGPTIGGRDLPTFGRSFDAAVWYCEPRPIR